jgi:hypothetical protein
MFVPEQRAAVRGWLLVAFGALFLFAAVAWMVEDATEFIVYISRKAAMGALATVMITGAVLAVDVFTPHDWFEQVATDARASSNIMCAVALGTALVLCFI